VVVVQLQPAVVVVMVVEEVQPQPAVVAVMVVEVAPAEEHNAEAALVEELEHSVADAEERGNGTACFGPHAAEEFSPPAVEWCLLQVDLLWVCGAIDAASGTGQALQTRALPPGADGAQRSTAHSRRC